MEHLARRLYNAALTQKGSKYASSTETAGCRDHRCISRCWSRDRMRLCREGSPHRSARTWTGGARGCSAGCGSSRRSSSCTDVADPEAVERAAATVEREFGAIDVWVNNAMTSVFAPFWEITPEEFRRATEVTYLGFVYGTMAALKRMRPRDHGTIIQVGSALAYQSIPLQSAYCLLWCKTCHCRFYRFDPN